MDNNTKLEKPNNSGAGCITLFGAVFLFFGLMAGFMGLKPVIKGLSASDWQVTTATVLEANLETHRNDGSTTYSATGKFQYEWKGQTYISEQINFSRGSDNIGSYQQDLVNKLLNAKERNDNINIWVNPNNPSEAVFDKETRWGMVAFTSLFFVLFGGVGASIIAAGHLATKVAKRENERMQLYPEEPWRWKDHWQTPVIKNNNKALFLSTLIFAVIWNLVSSPMFFIVPQEISEKKNYIALIGLLFPIIGIGLGVWAFKNYKKWQRFKDTAFTLDTYPVFLGQHLRGTLSMFEQLPMHTQIKVKFSCINKTSGSGKNSTSRENSLWQDEQIIPASAGTYSDKYYLPIQFRVPSNQPISNTDNARSKFFWLLTVESELEGTNFNQKFELPVFKSKHENLDYSDDEVDIANQYSDTDDKEDNHYAYQGHWENTSAKYNFDGRTHNYFFAPARHKRVAIFVSITGLIFGSIAAAGLFIKSVSFAMGVICAIISSFIISAALKLWLHRIEIHVNQQQLIVRSGMFWKKQEILNSEDIKALSIKNTMRAGDTLYYDVFAEPYLSRKIRIASALLGKRDTEALTDKIADELGLEKDKVIKL